MFNPTSADTNDFFDSVCSMFSLSPDDIQNFEIYSEFIEKRETLVLAITLRDERSDCPRCGHPFPKIHSYTTKRIAHQILKGRNCLIQLRQRRYRCPCCSKTWSQYSPFTIKMKKISIETTVDILEALRRPEATFTQVAREFHLSAPTVIDLFDTHVNPSRLPMAPYMCIDENYCIRNGRSNYACILLNFLTQEAIDILPNRFKSDLINYFNSIPLVERKIVKAIGIDMYPNYRDVILHCFPNAKPVIDRFHLVKEFSARQDTVRKKIQNETYSEMQKLKKQMISLKERNDFQSEAVQSQYRPILEKFSAVSEQYHLLKKFSWLLFISPNDPRLDPGRKREYNHRLKRYLNYYELYQMILSLHPSLKICAEFRGMLTDLYTCNSSFQGEEYFTSFQEQLSKSRVSEMQKFGRTMKRWKTEILNSLDTVETVTKIEKDGSVTIQNRRLHNGNIERKNAVIKVVKNVANGYTNFARFRARLLYVLRDREPYAADPIYPSKARRKKDDRKDGHYD